MSWRKASLRILGLGGFALFGLVFFITFLSPVTFERAGKSLLLDQVEERVNRHLSTRNEAEISDIRNMLRARIPEMVAAVVTEMQDLDCECRNRFARSLRKNLLVRVSSLEEMRPKLKTLMQEKYVEVAERLFLDLRIFSATNACAFLILLVVSFLKPSAIAHLFLPGALLLLSMSISIHFYLFEQNWFFTMVFNDYVGWSYVVYLAAVFSILCDIVFNKARVTTGILNQILSALGRASSLAPC